MSERAVRIKPGMSREERANVVKSAQLVTQKIVHDDELRKAVVVLLKHLQEAIADDLYRPKRGVSLEEVGRVDEYTRALMFGVDDAATQLTDPNELVNLIAAIHEQKEKHQ